jgi:hypothetical protein
MTRDGAESKLWTGTRMVFAKDRWPRFQQARSQQQSAVALDEFQRLLFETA